MSARLFFPEICFARSGGGQIHGHTPGTPGTRPADRGARMGQKSVVCVCPVRGFPGSALFRWFSGGPAPFSLVFRWAPRSRFLVVFCRRCCCLLFACLLVSGSAGGSLNCRLAAIWAQVLKTTI